MIIFILTKSSTELILIQCVDEFTVKLICYKSSFTTVTPHGYLTRITFAVMFLDM